MAIFGHLKERASANNDVTALFCLLAASCILVVPLVTLGFPENFDLPQHLRFARTFLETISSGHIIPVWASADNAGFGSIGVRLYPPLIYLVMSCIQFVIHSWYDTLWLFILICMFGSCASMYFLAKEWLPPGYALSAAMLYAIVPYHLIEIYQAFLLAEFAAAAIMPLCFLFAYRVVVRDRWFDALALSACFSALVLTHIPTTIIVLPSLGIFVLFQIERNNLVRTAVRLAMAAALSLAVTGFYSIQFLTELNWVKHNSQEFYAAGTYNYADYFFPLFLNSGESYVPRFLWLWDAIIGLTLLLFIPLAVFLIVRMVRRISVPRHYYAVAAVGIFAFFMMSSLSTFVWTNLSVLQKLQFPWRWLTVTSLFGSIAFVFAVFEFLRRTEKPGRIPAYALAMIVAAMVVIDSTQLIVPSTQVSRAAFSQKLDSLDDERGCGCWWPVWATEKAFDRRDPAIAENRAVSITRWDSNAREFSISPGPAGFARLATFYYPYWTARINGIPQEVHADADGSLVVPIGAELSKINVDFREPASYSAARYLSLVAIIGLLIGLAACRSARRSDEISASFGKRLC
jgi:hypothetical protein